MNLNFLRHSRLDWVSIVRDGVHGILFRADARGWIPAFAGMTILFFSLISVAHADTSAVDPQLCQALTKHTPSADVNYQPGVDVNGKPVAPADLPGSAQMQVPDKFDIPLTLSLAKVLNLNTSRAPFNTLGTGTEIQLGSLHVEGDKVLYNGKPLSDTQQDNLAVLCMKQK